MKLRSFRWLQREHSDGSALPVRPEWHAAAACRDMPPDVFFPTSRGPEVWDAARQVCAGCPVRLRCLDEAVRRGDQWGMWGGLTPRERLDARS